MSDPMNDAELTLLSLLAESERYDYEFNTLIEGRGLRAWVNIGLSSILYLLGRLEDQGLISSTPRQDPHGNPRKLYRLTAAGNGVLQTAVTERLRQPSALGTPFEIGLANLHVLTPRKVYQLLMQNRRDLALRVNHIEGIINNRPPDITDSITALYTHSLNAMQAELIWLDSFLDDWKARYPAVVNDNPQEQTRISGAVESDDANNQMQILKRPRPADAPEE